MGEERVWMKEPLLLLPGMMCDARLFSSQLTAFSGERPVMVAPMIGSCDVEALAQGILENCPPHFALSGLSMGGILAMEMIHQAPERITRLALLDTNPLAEKPEVAAGRTPQIEAARNGQLRRVMRDEMKPRYLADGAGRGAILDLCMAMAESLGPDVFIDQSIALRNRSDQCETLRSVAVPTLVLCGEADGLCPVERHELMRDLIPGSKLVVVAEAGHLPVLENPAATNAALADWLEEQIEK